MGVRSAVAGPAPAAGPTVGGALVSGLNVPIGAAALVGALVVVPDARTGQRTSPDLPGAALSTSGPGLLVYGLIEGEHHDWGTIEPTSLGVQPRVHDRAVRNTEKQGRVPAGR
ncbi:hypothetical protein [Streptomyces sp. NPDC003717]|uniref:hypothetical protein n=1 Tax=Streptomyces sp. NPDC003717 TaxID=3154276 RepID=UPI0033A87CF4